VKVEVKDVKRLVLRGRRVDDGSGRVHADWVDAKLTK
jgi:hypothetical protein